MPLSIDDIINIQFNNTPVTLVPSMVRNVALLVTLKVGATEPAEGFAKVTSKTEADLLTDFDTSAFFNANFEYIFLVFDKTKVSTVDKYCRTLINTVDADFTGVVFSHVRVALLSEVNNDNNAWVNSGLNCGVLDNSLDTLIGLFVTFLKQNTFTSLQYANLSASPVVNTTGAFTNKYTYFDYDQITLTTPVLANFKIGGYDAKDIYINYEIKEKLQQQLFSLIQSGRLTYSDANIAVLEVSGRAIFDQYVGRGLIESYEFNIPRRSQNTSADIAQGVLKAINGTMVNSSSIWRALGDIAITV